MLLENKVVFLTGGAGGIGRECALAYVREGASVVIRILMPIRRVRLQRISGQPL
jgi:NAD(P)-dependent dehydrogenase (short-subunit alcohol dehydrogenase family)